MFIELAYCSLEKYWVAVDSALQNGLPQTAVQNLDTISDNCPTRKRIQRMDARVISKDSDRSDDSGQQT